MEEEREDLRAVIIYPGHTSWKVGQIVAGEELNEVNSEVRMAGGDTAQGMFITYLFKRHEPILKRAVQGPGFRYVMPEGGEVAIRAGLVKAKDDSWENSDDPRVSNGFSLTDIGRAVVVAMGWTCKCSGCIAWSAHKEVGQSLAVDGMCSGCAAGIDQYGENEYNGEASCKFHVLALEDTNAVT